MLSLPDNDQADVIEAFNSTSRYLDDLLNFDNPYFDHIYWSYISLNLGKNKCIILKRFFGLGLVHK